MTLYRNAATGDFTRVDEDDALAVTALEGLGYSEFGMKELQDKIKAKAQAVKDAKASVPAPAPSPEGSQTTETPTASTAPVAPAVPKKA